MADHKKSKQNNYNVPFDYNHFEKLAKKGFAFSLGDTFTQIYHTNLWAGNDSLSGQGSGTDQTAEIAARLPALLKQYKIRTLLDLPCGDFNWMSRLDLDLDMYTGGDIVAEIIEKNQQFFLSQHRMFKVLDITCDELPAADILLCRDCLVHLSFEDIFKALANIKKSSIPYLLTTTFTLFRDNHDIVTGDWRPINLQKAPFNLPAPLELINEKCSEGSGAFSDKSLGLWNLENLF